MVRHLGSGEVAIELPLFKRVRHLRPLTDGVVSVGQAHVYGGHRSILWEEEQQFTVRSVYLGDISLLKDFDMQACQ